MSGSWAGGYVVDVEYVSGYYSELAPRHLQLALNAKNLVGRDLDRPFTYIELGAGQGTSTAAIAAANPNGRFWAVDINPSQILNAEALVEGCGIENLTVLEASFADLDRLDLPRMDYICLHGIWSWVTGPIRQQIVDFCRTHLKTGGIVFCSYNAMPGWASLQPLREILRRKAHSSGKASSTAAMQEALAFAARLKDAQTRYYLENPVAVHRLDGLPKLELNYLVHEYLHEAWYPAWFSEVQADLAEAHLDFVGTATFAEMVPSLRMTPAAMQMLAEQADTTELEFLTDIVCNTVFRRDVFTRGRMAARSQHEALMSGWFALWGARDAAKLTVTLPIGEAQLAPDIYEPMLDVLADGPIQLSELAKDKRCARLTTQQLAEGILVLLGVGYAKPVLAPESAKPRQEACRRFNRGQSRRTDLGGSVLLASPVLGGGVAVDMMDYLFLNAEAHKREPIAFARDQLRAAQRFVAKDGVTLHTEPEIVARMQELLAGYKRHGRAQLATYGLTEADMRPTG